MNILGAHCFPGQWGGVILLSDINYRHLLMPLRASVLITAVFQRRRINDGVRLWVGRAEQLARYSGTLWDAAHWGSVETKSKMACSKNGRAPCGVGGIYTRVCIYVVTWDVSLMCWYLSEPHWKNTQEAKPQLLISGKGNWTSGVER